MLPGPLPSSSASVLSLWKVSPNSPHEVLRKVATCPSGGKLCQGTLEEREFFIKLLKEANPRKMTHPLPSPRMSLLVGTLEIIWFKLLIEETRELMGREFKSIGKFMPKL